MTSRATLAVCLVALLVGPMAMVTVSASAAPDVVSGQGATPAVSLGSDGVTAAVSASNQSTGPTLEDGQDATVERSTDGSAKVSSRLQQRIEVAESGGDRVATTGTTSDTVTVVVEAKPGSASGVADRVDQAGGKTVAQNRELVEAEVPAAAVDALANDESVAFVRAPIRPSVSTVESEGLGPINATWAHDRNITGENVTVAVIDIEGFNLTNPEISDQVTAHRDFTGKGIGNGTTGQHGTGVAEIVADTAPGAEIVPVRVSSVPQWRNAVDHIRDNTSTDVVVMSLAWFGVGPLDGTSDMNRRISRLRDDGVVWVNSAGNQGHQEHWNGTWNDPDGDGWMNFTQTDETLNLTSGTEASVWMNWNDWEAQNDDYDLYVLNDSGGVIGSSENRQNGSAAPPYEIYENRATPSTIQLAIKRVNATGDADFDIWFRGNYEPEYWTAKRSVVNPAVGPNVTTVGAVPASDPTTIEQFSSRGPTIDGRLKPDLVAPDAVSTSTYSGLFYGTSAAAPHAGGVAALLLGVNESLRPGGVEHALRTTATDVNGTAPDTTYGYGLVDAAAAVQSPVAELNRTAIDFGAVRLSETATQTVAVTNRGVRPLNLTDVAVVGPNATAYAVTNGGPGVVGVGQTHNISVTMDSQRRGNRNATLRLTHNGTDGETTVALTGQTIAPDVRATPSTTVDFGTVTLRNGTGTASVAVENNGTVALNVTNATVSGTNADAFAVNATGHQPPTVLAPGETVTYDLNASVTTTGVRNATLELDHNVTDRPTVTRSLTVTGVDRNPPEITQATVTADGANGTVLGRAGTATVSVAATDEGGVDTVTVNATPLGGSTVQLSSDGGDWYNATVAVDAANATEGTHRLTVNATDEQGQAEVTETVPVTLDLTNTTLTVEMPATNVTQNTTTVDVAATATDTLTAVSTVETQLDGGSWHAMVLSNGTWNRTFSGLADGTHMIALRATDAGGNAGPVRTRSLMVDTSRPTIDTVAPADGATVSTTQPTIEAHYADAVSGVNVDSVSLTVDGTTVTDSLTVSSSSVSYTPTLSSEEHTATVNVTDDAGNVGERNWSFTVSEPSTTSGGGGGTSTSGGGGGTSTSGGGGGTSGGGGGSASTSDDDDDTTSAGTMLVGTAANVTVTGQALSGVGFTSQTELLTSVTVTELSGSPTDAPSSMSFIAGADIGFPSGGSDSIETVQLTLRQSRLDELGVAAEELKIFHHNEMAGRWDGLETTVIERDSSIVTVEAPSAGFSVYAVFATTAATEPTAKTSGESSSGSDTPTSAPDSSDTPTPAPDSSDTPTSAPDSSDTPTTGESGPGFTILSSLVALLVVTVLARYRS